MYEYFPKVSYKSFSSTENAIGSFSPAYETHVGPLIVQSSKSGRFISRALLSSALEYAIKI